MVGAASNGGRLPESGEGTIRSALTCVEDGGLGAGGEEEGDGDEEAADDDRQQPEPLRLEPHAADEDATLLLHAAQPALTQPRSLALPRRGMQELRAAASSLGRLLGDGRA